MNKRYRQCDAADCRHYGTAVCVDIGNDGLWDMLPAAGIVASLPLSCTGFIVLLMSEYRTSLRMYFFAVV